MLFIDINGVLIKKGFFVVVTSDEIQNYMPKKVTKNGGERHFIRPLARPLVVELVLTARLVGARERNADPYVVYVVNTLKFINSF